MTFDELISTLKGATEDPPRAALAASGPHAAALAPEVYARIAKMCRGVHLMPPDANIVFYGIHVLAAARQADLWPRLIDLARLKEGEVEDIFPFKTETALTQVMLSVWDGDADALFRLIEHADLDEVAKWALFDVLARLTFDDRIPRERTMAFLERFERDGLADKSDLAWWGWESAVTRLGLVELEPALDRVSKTTICKDRTQDEREAALADMRIAVADPTNAAVFENAGIVPLASATVIADWIDAQAEAIAEWLSAEPPATAQTEAPDDDPAKDIRLNPFELAWLEGFLASRQVPPGTMSVEMLDGFITALVIGPKTISPTQYLDEVWGAADGTGPAWDDIEQGNFVLSLVMRMHNSVVARRMAGARHVPLIDTVDDDVAGAEWADGFLLGVDLGEDAWEPMWDDPRGEDYLTAIEALIGEGAEGEAPLTRKQRAHTLERLPVIVQRIAAFWLNPSRGFRGPEPVRVVKVGRNDPCPCGSGQKYKKCCALKPPPVMH